MWPFRSVWRFGGVRVVIPKSGFGSVSVRRVVGVAPEGEPTGFGSAAFLAVYLIVIVIARAHESKRSTYMCAHEQPGESLQDKVFATQTTVPCYKQVVITVDRRGGSQASAPISAPTATRTAALVGSADVPRPPNRRRRPSTGKARPDCGPRLSEAAMSPSGGQTPVMLASLSTASRGCPALRPPVCAR